MDDRSCLCYIVIVFIISIGNKDVSFCIVREGVILAGRSDDSYRPLYLS